MLITDNIPFKYWEEGGSNWINCHLILTAFFFKTKRGNKDYLLEGEHIRNNQKNKVMHHFFVDHWLINKWGFCIDNKNR